jgi:O-antigen/teichoic acid export membrane protein
VWPADDEEKATPPRDEAPLHTRSGRRRGSTTRYGRRGSGITSKDLNQEPGATTARRTTTRAVGTPQASGSVLSGAGVMLASRLTVAILGWVGTILIARHLSESDWGAYSLIFNIVGIVGLLADLQISRVVMVEILDDGDDKARLERTVGYYVALRLALALASYVLAVAVVLLAGYSHDIVVGTLVAGLSFFMASTLWALVTVCQIRLWMRPVAIALVLGQFVQLALTVVLYATHTGTVVRYAVPAVLYDFTSVVFVVFAVWPVVRVRPRIDFSRWWRWVKAAVPLALGSSLATLYFRIDAVMLSKLDRSADPVATVGKYQYGYKFSDVLAFVASSLLGVVLPLLVRAWPGDVPQFHKVFRQAFLVLVIAGIAAAGGFAVVAGPALTGLFHAPPSAALPARVLVLGQALNFFSQLCAMTLIATNRHRIYPWASLAGLTSNIILNVLLIPHFSATGAGMATVFTELIVIGAMTTIILRIPGVRPLPWRSVAIVTLSGAVMAGTTYALTQVVWWPVALLVGVVVYLAALHVLRVDGRGGLRKLWHESRVDLGGVPAR